MGQPLSYDPNHQLVSLVDEASGRSLTFEYNPDGLIARILGPVTDAVPSGIHAAYAYTRGNLTSVIRADGSGYEYTYDDTTDSPNLIEKRDHAGHFLSSWAYDSQDRAYLNITRDGTGNTIDYTDPFAIKVTDAHGNTRIHTMDMAGGRSVITEITGTSGCAACNGEVVGYQYDDHVISGAGPPGETQKNHQTGLELHPICLRHHGEPLLRYRSPGENHCLHLQQPEPAVRGTGSRGRGHKNLP